MYAYRQRQKERQIETKVDRELVLPFSSHILNISEKSKQDIFHSCRLFHFKSFPQ